jgi:hypothetical protein
MRTPDAEGLQRLCQEYQRMRGVGGAAMTSIHAVFTTSLGDAAPTAAHA